MDGWLNRGTYNDDGKVYLHTQTALTYLLQIPETTYGEWKRACCFVLGSFLIRSRFQRSRAEERAD